MNIIYEHVRYHGKELPYDTFTDLVVRIFDNKKHVTYEATLLELVDFYVKNKLNIDIDNY